MSEIVIHDTHFPIQELLEEDATHTMRGKNESTPSNKIEITREHLETHVSKNKLDTLIIEPYKPVSSETGLIMHKSEGSSGGGP
jgi:hypothetical protein